MLWYVLCCAVLCCAVLCCAVLCCAVLCCAVLCCAVLCCAVLCCAVLCCAALRCAAVRWAAVCLVQAVCRPLNSLPATCTTELANCAWHSSAAQAADVNNRLHNLLHSHCLLACSFKYPFIHHSSHYCSGSGCACTAVATSLCTALFCQSRHSHYRRRSFVLGSMEPA